jgi:hypothetical protein
MTRKGLSVIVIGVICLIVVVAVVFWVTRVPFVPRGNGGAKNATVAGRAVPTRSQPPTGNVSFSVMQSSSTLPIFVKGSVDPANVALGAIQKFDIVLSDPAKITSVVATTVTDHGTSTVTLVASGTDEFAGQWKVEDTHGARYTTLFVAKDDAGRENTLPLSWLDLDCGQQDMGGYPWYLSTADGCSVPQGVNDVIQNGSIYINSGVLYVYGTLFYSPGYDIYFDGGTVVLVQSTGGRIVSACQ